MATGDSEAITATVSNVQELRTFCTWFKEWNTDNRRIFLQSLIPIVVPNKLFVQISRLTVSQTISSAFSHWSQCTTFDQQLVYFHQCFSKWSADEANHFVSLLEEIDMSLVYNFYDMIAITAGEL